MVAVVERFEKECIFLSESCHPNVVLFMGVYFKERVQFPVLLMELLPISLSGALTKYPNIPAHIKNVILYDIACGLSFFHTQTKPLIHRDLSSNNVLLSENFRAKIADFGMAKIPDPNLYKEKLTKIPGTAVFMPPEAFDDDPEYDQSLDMFSYGNLILNTVNQTWPRIKARVTSNKRVLSEIERRVEDLNKMGTTHPLRMLTERCLADEGADRPKAVEAVEELLKQMQDNCPPFDDRLKMTELITDFNRDNEGNKQQAKVSHIEIQESPCKWVF